MTDYAPFWLPSLFALDNKVYGALGEVNSSLTFNVDPVLTELGITTDFLVDFLDQIKHTFEALFLCGYVVPYVEIGIQHLTSVRMDEENTGAIWLRIDLQKRRIEAYRRTEHVNSNRIRFQTQKIATPEGDLSIQLDYDYANNLVPRLHGETDDAHTALAATMKSHLAGVIFRDTGLTEEVLVIHDDPVMTMADYRANLSGILMRDLDNDGLVTLPLGFRVDFTAFASPAEACIKVFEAFRHATFDTVTWILGHALLDKAGTTLDAYETAGINYDLTVKLPGMLWVLDNRYWEPLRPGDTTFVGYDKKMERLQIAPRMLMGAFEGTNTFTFNDLRNDSSAADPPLSSYLTEKRAGYLYGMIYGSGTDIQVEPAIRMPRTEMRPLERMIDVILGHSARRSRYEQKTRDRAKWHSYVGAENRYEKVTDTLEGLMYDGYVMQEAGAEQEFAAQEIDNIVGVFFREYRHVVDDFAGHYGMQTPGPIRKRARRESYLTVIMSLFNFGVFSLEMIVGDLNEVPVEPNVEALLDDGSDGDGAAGIRLRHTLYDLPGLKVWQHYTTPDTITLREMVAWEYIPAPPRPSAGIRAQMEAAGLYKPDERDRLVIVAGPGVAISQITSGWPASVTLDIYRVQSPALVPDGDERINIGLITQPYTIGILDDIDHHTVTAADPDNTLREGEAGVTRETQELDRRYQLQDLAPDHPDRLPFLTVTPVRKDNGKCGVTLATTYPRNMYYRGVDGEAAVEILMDQTSGADRFAFEVRYEIHKMRRAVGTHQETRIRYNRHSDIAVEEEVTVTDYDMVDVAQFHIIVHATSGVEILLKDNKTGPIWDLLHDISPDGWDMTTWIDDPVDDTCVYSFHRASSVNGAGPFAAIPDQGVPLWTVPAGFAPYTIPQNEAFNEAVVEHAKFMIDMSLGLIPVVGEATDVMELVASFYTGTDKWGRPISNFDRLLIAGGLALPLVSGKTLRVMKGELGNETLFRMLAGIE